MNRNVPMIAALLVSAAALAQTPAADPVGTVSYSLPSTVISLEVEAEQEVFHAGPYARFASKYLGMEARQQDEVTYRVTGVQMTPLVEADQSARYSITIGSKQAAASFLALSSQGLVSVADASVNASQWRFPSPVAADFSSGTPSALTSGSTTLIQGGKKGSAAAVTQDVIVEKSLEKRAAETSENIFRVRQQRLDIVTGNTGATYSGEALGAAIAELTRLEKEYMQMFIGYSEYQSQSAHFEVVPEPSSASQKYIAFRISETRGLVPADDLSGKPVVMEITVPQMTVAAPSKKDSKAVVAHYRVPAVCSVKLVDGTEVLLKSRVPVYQLGYESTFPVNLNVKQ
ncbi:MAG: DUF4831 family protein [Bacteroidales bacterium]|nr:DUF4831 family protein [Bacteroidales bacterium]